MHKILWDFEIQTHHLIPARKPDLMLNEQKKRICHFVDFAIPADCRVKIKNAKRETSTWILSENKKICETCGWWWY